MALKPILPNLTGLVEMPHRSLPPVFPKRTRASKPKVRTGCSTCKTRRVKCDEAKPICQRCKKAGITCDGYDKPPAARPPAPRKPANSQAFLRRATTGLILARPRLRPNPAACNMEAVDGLLTTGVALLKDSLELYRHGTPPQDAATPARPEDDMEDIETILPYLSIMGGYTPFLRSQKNNLVLWESSASSDVPDTSCRSFSQIQSMWNKFFTRAAAFTGQSFMEQLQNLPIDKAAIREQQAYRTELERWWPVLEINLARATTSGDKRAKRSLQMMQLHFLMIQICLECCHDRTDMMWDEYDNEFLVLVERCLAFAVEDMTGYHAGFTLSMGGLSMLGPAIAKCRNHDIRMRALEVVRRMPWREGAWDACAEVTAQLGAVLLEERGRDANGFVSAENRWTWIGGEWDLDRGVLYGQYMRSVPDANGGPVVTSLEVDLDAWPNICEEVSCFKDHSIDCRVLDTLGGLTSSS
ncbi:hypothetical protein GQ53DRAFT_716766 [Thozetella sp. PMI_491]|nr:hypothetical protein GQ53DRAFT_716766 [Thozetella sp. PMI_491]